VSLLAGVSPGIHYPHSEYYIRRIRISKDNALVKLLHDHGYSSTLERNESEVFEFPVHCQHFIRSKEDVSIWEQVKNAADYQHWWADNSVSITVTFKEEEAGDIPRVLEAYEDKLKTISFLKLVKNIYPLMPYEEITKDEYKKMFSKITPIDFTKFNNYGNEVIDKFCDGDKCNLTF
jgi:hypothetical protein